MTTLFLAASLVAASAAERELEAQLPEIFAKSAEHYKALDAAATPLMRNAKGEAQTPHGWNKWRTGKDEFDMRSIFWWTSGHYPGALWHLYDATGDAFFKDRATAWTELLEPVKTYEGNHDIGFMTFCSFGTARRLLQTDRYDAILKTAATTLCKRFNARLGLIRSWGQTDDEKDFLVIPDNLMNLELLEWAAGQPEGKRFAEIAESHADVTMRHHFRPDGGCFHVLNYDQKNGRIQEVRRGQGASCETVWSRGQSWGIYGYTMMYRSTGRIRYLDFAKKLADYAINHPNMPADGIPFWDYGAPGEERDSSAGAIMASALIELSQYVGETERSRYRAFAVRQLLALASPAYFSRDSEIGHFLLKHGVGAKPGNKEIDTPLDYGDYYFLEALIRFRNLRRREATCEEAVKMLPATASLPEDELLLRARGNGMPTGSVAHAVSLLAKPIPDTSDELYGEYWTIGNRTHYQEMFFGRLNRLCILADAERQEGKGRFLPELERTIEAICRMKTWILPAHDSAGLPRGTFRGIVMNTDLFSTEVGALLACVVRTLGPKLNPALVARIKAECERRVFAPVRREMPTKLFPETAVDGLRVPLLWWIDGRNNWNAVCWDNVVCTACGLLDDPSDRALFVTAAIRAAAIYVREGFAADGYCTEGMGYWNYGYGHHLMTGRLLDRLSGGKLRFLASEKERLIAGYARAYTLCEGVSPAFADGNGAADPKLLDIVDEFWPDLPKSMPPVSEFPVGQVWLFRSPEALSVAVKGGHNGEFHNHNDVGTYYVTDCGRFVSGDPGNETYTARTFSARRYESKVLNSYGHPVPVVGGQLQKNGAKAAAKVVSKDLASETRMVVLDLTAAYDVPTLKSLTRAFAYAADGSAFTVRDHAVFTEPTAFEDCYVTFGNKVDVSVRVLKGGETSASEDVFENPGKKSPHRHALTFKAPVTEAEIEFSFKPQRQERK